jgi:hypothetical protein
MFAHLFGIKPWELHDLTAEQFDAMKMYADAMNRSNDG